MRIALIVPCLNEAAHITTTLARLQTLRHNGHQIIVVDGHSDDNTAALAAPLASQVVSCQRGRARQMNHGAQLADDADVLLFLHADTRLPEAADKLIVDKLSQSSRQWGRFDVRLSGEQLCLRLVEFMMNQRSRLSAIATGDQAIFVRRGLFEKIDGFPDIALMEDIGLSKRLKQHSKPIHLPEKVITSSRRWEQQGVWRTILLMWRLRLAYFFGADPQQLKRQYDS